jgi:hypothetical protein
MKTNVSTYYVVSGKAVLESKFQSLVEEANAANQPKPEPTKMQSFALPEAESIEEMKQLCPSEEVLVSLFNRAATIKMQSFARLEITDEDFVPKDGTYDLTSIIAEPAERRTASPEAKIEKLLSGMDEEAIQRILARILEKQTAPAGTSASA